MCNPPSSLHTYANAIWYCIMMIFTILTVLFYSVAFVVLHYKQVHKNANVQFLERMCMRTLKYLIVLFVVFRFITSIILNLLHIIHVNREVVSFVENFNVHFKKLY